MVGWCGGGGVFCASESCGIRREVGKESVLLELVVPASAVGEEVEEGAQTARGFEALRGNCPYSSAKY